MLLISGVITASLHVFQCDGKFCQSSYGQSGELNCPFDVAGNNNNHLASC